MSESEAVKMQSNAKWFTGTWHWIYALSGALCSIAMGALTPQIDMWFGLTSGQLMLWWVALISVYLGGILWGLSHAASPKHPLWLILQLAALPVTLAFIAFQLTITPALLVLAASSLLTAISQRLIFSGTGLSRLFGVYAAALGLGCLIAVTRLFYS